MCGWGHLAEKEREREHKMSVHLFRCVGGWWKDEAR